MNVKKNFLQEGARYNHWTILGLDHQQKYQWFYKCQCDCGRIRVVREDYLTRGKSRCCGCIRKDTPKWGLDRRQEFLEDLSTLRTQEIVDKYELSFSQIRAYREKNNIPSPYQTKTEELKQSIISLYHDGLTIQEISKQVKLSSVVVYKKLQNYGFNPSTYSYFASSSESPYEDIDRATWGGFKEYWSARADYFDDVFAMDYNNKNAWIAFNELNG